MLRIEGIDLREALETRGCSALFVSCVTEGRPIPITRAANVGGWFTRGTLSRPFPSWWTRALERPLVLVEGAHDTFCTLDDLHPRPRVRAWVAGIDYRELPKGEALTAWLWRRAQLEVSDVDALREAILAMCDGAERDDWNRRWAES